MDDELAAIRAKRLAELQAQHGNVGQNGGVQGMNQPGSDAKSEQQEEARRSMLRQVLDNEARERLARISMVKPEKARAVEDLLLRMARVGQLKGKIGEKQLIELLEQINQQQQQETKIVFTRRRNFDSDSDEYDL